MDIIYMMLYRTMDWVEWQLLYPPTSKLQLSLEVISVIPVDLTYYIISGSPSTKILIFLRLRYALRITRCVSEITRMKNTVGSNNLVVILMEYTLVMAIALFASNCVAYIIVCSDVTCSHEDASTYLRLLYEVAGKITTRCFHTKQDTRFSLLYAFLITNVGMYIYLKGFIVAKFVTAFKQLNLHWGVFSIKTIVMYKRYKKLFKNDKLLKSTLETYYGAFWKVRQGILNVNMASVLPEIRQSEIKLDLSWKCFQHSHLFRAEDTHFLHYLSSYVTNYFKSAGEVLYKSGEIKSRMIYLAAGTVQIYSDEDGETPILSFSGGTCLGETSLILCTESVCNVVCQSDCEVDVLEAKSFIKIMKKYPEKYRKFRMSVLKRYDEAKNYHDVKFFQRDYLNIKESSQLLTIKWIKLTLNKLLSSDAHYLDSYMKTLNIEERLLTVTLTKLFFCPHYLDLFVLTKEVDLVEDTIFVKATFPCILQPDAILTQIWEKVVAVALLALTFVYPLYMAFYREMTLFYLFFIGLITCMWSLDVFIQVSTAIRTRNGLITTIPRIFERKATEKLFVLDLLSAVPLELLATLLSSGMSENQLLFLQVNRLFKFARIENLFKHNSKSLNTHLVLTNFLKWALYFVILIYWIAGLIYLLALQVGRDSVYLGFFRDIGATSPGEDLMGCVFLATLLVTGLNVYLPKLANQSSLIVVPLVLVVILTMVIYLIFLGNMTATMSIRGHGKLLLQEYYSNIKYILKNFHFDHEFCDRIYRYTNHQWLTTNGVDFLQKSALLKDVPEELFLIIRRCYLAEYLRKVPLFQEIPVKLLAEYSVRFTFWDIPAGQVVTYAGEVAREMYIINAGFCEIISGDGHLRRTVGPGESFAVLETCMEVPIVNNVITTTDCVLISITYDEFVQASSSDPEMLTQFREAVKGMVGGWAQLSGEKEELHRDRFLKLKNVSNASFIFFGYRLNPDSERGRTYFGPFEKLGYWSFIRYFLMRITIRSHGKFAHYWEVSRFTTCFVSVIFSTLPYVSSCYYCFWWWFFRLLDMHCLMDIYIRHHICYFDDKGIEVTHPLKTATHYWKHSFITDVLALIPLLQVVHFIRGSRVVRPHVRAMLGYNKMLQLYRIVQGLHYMTQGVDVKLKLWTAVMYIPFAIIAVVTLGTLLFNFTCDFGHYPATELFGERVRCDKSVWIGPSSKFSKPISFFRVCFYCFYYVTTVITGIGLNGYYMENFIQISGITVLSFIGFLCFEMTSSKIVAVNLSRNVNLTMYQEATRVLMEFLNLKRIDDKLRLELVEHFEYVFFKLRGVSYEDSFSLYNNALREEAMYKMFGGTMKESEIFRNAYPSFFRSLLIYTRYQIIMKRGIIHRVNDISGTIYFIFKGQVDVLGPDYNRLVILPVGSMFGNLDEVAYSRRTLTMVAKGHVELLKIETANFYKVLNKYSRLRAHFRQLIMLNMDYIAGGPLPKETCIVNAVVKSMSTKSKKQQAPQIRHTTLLGRFFKSISSVRAISGPTKVWEAVVLFVICFIGFIIELYRVTMRDRTLTLIVVLCIFDIMYIFKIYFKFHTHYITGFGTVVTTKREIAMHYLKDTAGFRLDIISVVPLELLAFIFVVNSNTFWTVYIYCRCNKLIRVFFVIQYFYRTNKKININVYRVRALQMLVFIVLTLEIATSVLIFVGCFDEKINTFPQMQCNFHEMTSLQKYIYFIVQLSNVVSIFTATSFREFYPNSTVMITLLIVYMLMCRMLIMQFMAEICAALEVILSNRLNYEQKIIRFKKLTTMQNLSPVLVEKTWTYLRLLWSKQSGLQFPSLLEEAPYYLREAVLNSMFGYHLRSHPVLKNCHVDLIRQMAAMMRTRVFFPGDRVAYKDVADECMYFVHDGEIFGLSEDTVCTEVTAKVFRAGDMFGLKQGMHARVGHEYTYKVNRCSVVVVLARSTWIHLLDFFPASKMLIFDESIDT